MKYIGYVFLGISLFIIGVASYLIFDDKSKEKKRIAASTAKAREAKTLKALERKMDIEIEEPQNDLEELHNRIIDNGSTKETVES
jgi:hypothetical protein